MPGATLVVPCFNEARRLDAAAFLEFVERQAGAVRLLFVDDGSADGTREVLESLRRRSAAIAVLALEQNAGKAAAVRRGVLAALAGGAAGAPDHVGYWDADLATPLDELPRMLAVFGRKPEVCAVIGSRVNRRGADIRRLWYRHYLGRLFATAADLALRIRVYDTQCGAKLFAAECARRVFAAPFATRWLFDIELILRILELEPRAAAGGRIFELPLESWRDVRGGKLRPGDFLKAPLELWRIVRRYRGAGGAAPFRSDAPPGSA